MSDIVERLRAEAMAFRGRPDCVGPAVTLLTEEAADEIERLRAALERIDKMEAYFYEDSRDVLYAKIGVMRDIARAALEPRHDR